MKIRFSPRVAIGLTLIIVSVVLWQNKIRRDTILSERAEKVSKILADFPVLAIGVRVTPQEADQSIGKSYTPCSPAVVSNILDRLRVAEPVTQLPNNLSSSYDLFIFYTNRTCAMLHMQRAGESDEIFVQYSDPVGKNEKMQLLFESLPPIRITGLGSLFDEIDTGKFSGDGLRPLPALLGVSEKLGATTLDSLQAIAKFPFKDMRCISLVANGRSELKESLPKEQQEAIRQAFAQAQPVETFPESEGYEVNLQLQLKEGPIVLLRSAILDKDPDAAYIGFYEPSTNGFKISEPVRVPGIASILSAFRATTNAISTPAE